jgi:hypothetical protein
MARKFWVLKPSYLLEFSNPNKHEKYRDTGAFELLDSTELILILNELLTPFQTDPRYKQAIASLDRDRLKTLANYYEKIANGEDFLAYPHIQQTTGLSNLQSTHQ